MLRFLAICESSLYMFYVTTISSFSWEEYAGLEQLFAYFNLVASLRHFFLPAPVGGGGGVVGGCCCLSALFLFLFRGKWWFWPTQRNIIPIFWVQILGLEICTHYSVKFVRFWCYICSSCSSCTFSVLSSVVWLVCSFQATIFAPLFFKLLQRSVKYLLLVKYQFTICLDCP